MSRQKLEQITEDNYLRAKAHLEEILNGEDRVSKSLQIQVDMIRSVRKEAPLSYQFKLQEVGKNILKQIESLKNNLNENSLTLDDLTKTIEELTSFIQLNRRETNIDHLLEELRTKIKTDEYNKLRAKICMFIGLIVTLASIAVFAFCIATAAASLLPLPCVLLFLGAMIAGGGTSYFDGDKLDQAFEWGELKHYFFKSTTPDSEKARKSIFILEYNQENNRNQQNWTNIESIL